MLAPGVSISLKGLVHQENSDKEMMLHDNIIIARNEKQVVIGKKAYNLKSNKDYNSNNLLLQQLQPIPVRSAVTLGQGIKILMLWINTKLLHLRI